MPAGLGGVAAKLEVMLEEMLEVRGLPTGRMPSTSCNESRTGNGTLACRSLRRLGEARQGKKPGLRGPGAVPGLHC